MGNNNNNGRGGAGGARSPGNNQSQKPKPKPTSSGGGFAGLMVESSESESEEEEAMETPSTEAPETPLGEVSTPKLMTPDLFEKKLCATLDEFLASSDEAEASECLKELEAKDDLLNTVVSLAVLHVMEKKEEDRVKTNTLLAHFSTTGVIKPERSASRFGDGCANVRAICGQNNGCACCIQGSACQQHQRSARVCCGNFNRHQTLCVAV